MRPPLHEVDLGPGVRAAFTDARDAFDLSLALGDDRAAVLARRRRLQDWVGAPVAYARQVHGADVIVCTRAPRVDDVVGVADALVAGRDDLAVAVLVADCVPVLLADPGARVVAAVHAGRQGLVAGVVGAALDEMVRQGAAPDRVVAAVGPAACGRCYEVPERMRDEVDAAVPGTASTTAWGTAALDLPGAVRRGLRAAGVQVRDVGGCTIEEPRWFSHRGATSAAPDGRPRRPGRMAGVVRLLPLD